MCATANFNNENDLLSISCRRSIHTDVAYVVSISFIYILFFLFFISYFFYILYFCNRSRLLVNTKNRKFHVHVTYSTLSVSVGLH